MPFIFKVPPPLGWDLTNATYEGISLAVVEPGPNGVSFKPDGTKMYIPGSANPAKLYEYDLSTPWVVSTGILNNTFGVSTEDTNPREIIFKSDGTTFYIAGATNDRIYQYSTATTWNIFGSTNISNFDLTLQGATAPTGLFFKPDGTKMYVCSWDTRSVYQYTLSTAWDITTSLYDNTSFLVSESAGPPNSITNVAFSTNGNKMFVSSYNSKVFQYTLSTPWNIGTASYDSISATVADSRPSVGFKSDGTKMYIMGDIGNRVYQYTLI